MVNELCLDILGTKFTITANEDEAYLQDIYNQFRTAIVNTQNISGIKDPLNVAILTGFLLCDEINKIQQERNIALAKAGEDINSDELKEAGERARNLIARLDKVLEQTRADTASDE